MAEKRPKSILSGLKNMLHLDSEESSKPVSKRAAPARKKPAAAEAPPARKTKKEDAEPTATPPATDPAATPKPEKKVQSQPWYRHRQRW